MKCCVDCVFYEPLGMRELPEKGTLVYGCCHRRPPAVTATLDAPRWPMVYGIEGCGEYREDLNDRNL